MKKLVLTLINYYLLTQSPTALSSDKCLKKVLFSLSQKSTTFIKSAPSKVKTGTTRYFKEVLKTKGLRLLFKEADILEKDASKLERIQNKITRLYSFYLPRNKQVTIPLLMIESIPIVNYTSEKLEQVTNSIIEKNHRKKIEAILDSDYRFRDIKVSRIKRIKALKANLGNRTIYDSQEYGKLIRQVNEKAIEEALKRYNTLRSYLKRFTTDEAKGRDRTSLLDEILTSPALLIEYADIFEGLFFFQTPGFTENPAFIFSNEYELNRGHIKSLALINHATILALEEVSSGRLLKFLNQKPLAPNLSVDFFKNNSYIQTITQLYRQKKINKQEFNHHLMSEIYDQAFFNSLKVLDVEAIYDENTKLDLSIIHKENLGKILSSL